VAQFESKLSHYPLCAIPTRTERKGILLRVE
jgi:hypothetical protein